MITLLEQQITTTLLGLRFCDPADDRQIADGLVVTATAATARYTSPVYAFRTSSGIYAFPGLPGLRALEHRSVDEIVEGTSPPPALTYLIHVTDLQQRFLAALVPIELPLPYRGLYRPGGVASSPMDEAATKFYLFSAPTRTPPPGMAVVRTQLYDQTNARPAAFALIEVQTATGLWFGLAAPNGSAAVIFPYPTFIRSLANGSPPPLAEQQQWPLTMRIYYEPAVLTFPAGQTVPDLRTIRRQQLAQLFPMEGGPPVNEATGQLTFEEESRFATAGRSHLVIAPAPSSP